tara:strand:+ start:702 stop:1580 length:879 start_codon:yes stop_codon:yes gene_type:complete
MRIAGAQIPVGTDIQSNKKEILKAIDWAKENGVEQLLTPEGALSGYSSDNPEVDGWPLKMDEITDALKEVEEHQKKSGIGLHFGTCYQEQERIGTINRNQLRHYNSKGQLETITHKTFCIPMDLCLGRNQAMEPVQYFELAPNLVTVGMLCNDMWGQGSSFWEQHLAGKNLFLILHATNGIKFSDKDDRRHAFDKYSDAFLRMTAMKAVCPILTVDSCTPWNWDGSENMIDVCPTASESGVVDWLGWKTEVPRYGRQYFYYDLQTEYTHKSQYYQYDDDMVKYWPHQRLDQE